MPASLYLEEETLNLFLKKETPTAITKCYLGLTTAAISKKWTGTEVEEKEPSASASWARVEVSAASKPGWSVTKAEGATGFTIYENTNAIKTGAEAWEFKKITINEYKLEYFAICDALTKGNLLAFGKLTLPATINSGSTLEIAAKELKFEVE